MAIPSKTDMDAAPEVLLDGSCCKTVDEFFSIGSRDLIGRFLTSFIESLIITPTELVYSSKYQKRLGDAGRVMMNAVDKIATVQAKSINQSASERLKELNTLISAGMKRMWDEDKDRPVAYIAAEAFPAFLDSLKETGPARDYAFHRTLVEHLFQHKVWKDKVAALLRIHDLIKTRDESRAIEFVLSECFKSDAALDQMFGLFETLEERCDDLIALWKGEWKPRPNSHPGLVTINSWVAAGEAPNIKAAVEYALLRAMAAKDPIRSAEPEIEIQALFDLFKRLWTAQKTLIGGQKAMASVERRQARHLSKEGLTDLLRERKVLADRYAFLMQISAITIGQSNRATVRTFIEHYFGDKDFVPRVVAGQEPPVPKMQTFTTIHRAIRGSWLPDGDKAACCAKVEEAQALLLRNSRLFEQVDKKSGSPSQKVLTLLDLCRKGTFIDGPVMDQVRAVLNTFLRDPAFLPDYLGGSQGAEKDRKMELLTKTLGSIGITV